MFFIIEKIEEIYLEYKEYIFFIILFLLFLLSQVFIFYYFKKDLNHIENKIIQKPNKEEQKTVKEKDEEKYVVDIKGEVKTPGVYILEKNKRVIDVVKKAGGFTTKANPRINNLSKKIEDEMVIIIYSKNEVEKYVETKKEEELLEEKCNSEIVANNSCVETKNDDKKENDSNKKETNNNEDNMEENQNKKVSINTGTKEELMTINGIGESKANAIIEYRKTKKFSSIEEIKEVSGIGESVFEKIKEYITT